MQKRKLEVAVLSDIHLGTYGCHANEVVKYLKSIDPKILVLNGDIIDGWQFSKRYFPASHLQVIKEIMSMVSRNVKVFYITGNHDEMLRRYTDLQIGNFSLTDKLVLEIDGKTHWFFHGDVFDATTKGNAKILAKLGGHGYDLLILMNRVINWGLNLFGKEKMSFSKKIKNSVKQAVKWIDDFEQTSAELAIGKNYDYVICGHIHQPQQKTITTTNGSVTYLNSGDWVENLTALEYQNKQWSIYKYNEADMQAFTTPIIDITQKLPKLNVETNNIAMIVTSLITG